MITDNRSEELARRASWWEENVRIQSTDKGWKVWRCDTQCTAPESYLVFLPRVCFLDFEFLVRLSAIEELPDAQLAQVWEAWKAFAEMFNWPRRCPNLGRSPLGISFEDPAAQLLLNICGRLLTPKQRTQAMARWERQARRKHLVSFE